MQPELEDFLEEAFDAILPISSEVGRVVVEPDYDTAPNASDASELGQQLSNCLRHQSLAGEALRSHDGMEVSIPGEYGLLRKYLRRITLHADAVDGPWVEVAPPGNWI